MRIAIIGAGGLGGYFGARLQAAGNDVVFVACGQHLASLKAKGLLIKSGLGDLHLKRVQATDDLATIGAVDFVLVAVKLWDAEAVARGLGSVLQSRAAVISFQNGVDKDRVIADVLGPRAVMGGVCYIAAAITEPGVVTHAGTMQKLVFGATDGKLSCRAEAFLAMCGNSAIDAELSADIRRLTWEKLIFLVGLSGTTAAIRLPIGPIRSNPRTRAFLFDVMDEVVAVGRALQVDLAEDFAADRLRFIDTLPVEMTSSMHGDLKRGGRLELPWLADTVVELGRKTAVPTPANLAIADLLALHADGTLT